MFGPDGREHTAPEPFYNRATEAIGLHYARCVEV
jgi:hypothetical protein